MHWHKVDAPVDVLLRMSLLKLSGDAGHLALGLLHGYAGLEPRNGAKVAARFFPVINRRIECERHPGFHLVVEKLESRRHDADNRALPGADRGLFAEDLRVGGEPRLPQLMAENDYELISDRVLFGQEGATHERLHAQRSKERLADKLGLDLFRFAGPAREIDALICYCRHVFERSALLLPIEKVCRGYDILEPGGFSESPLPNHDDALGIRIRERTEQHAIDHTEDGGIRADAERESDHGREGEARFLQQRPHSVPQILKEDFESETGPSRAHFFLHLLDAADFHHRGAARFRFIHAFFHFFLR